MAYRAAITVAVALIVGVLALTAGTPSASAQTPAPKWFDPVSQAEKRVFDEIIRQSYGEDPVKRTTARNILTRQASRTIPRMSASVLARGGLVGAAAGVWTVVGLELYYLPCWECGQRTLSVNADLRAHPDNPHTVKVIGNPGTANESVMQGAVTAATATRDASGTFRTQIYMTRAVSKWAITTTSGGTQSYYAATVSGIIGHQYPNSNTISFRNPATWYQGDISVSGISSPPNYDRYGKGVLTGGDTGRAIKVMAGGTTELCPASPIECNKTKTFPVFDFGAVQPGTATGASPLRTSTIEGNQFINNVVADPETKPTVDPMDVPQQEPDPDWDPNTDPFSPIHDPFEDPKGDPDRDGDPNETDPDPEGDQDPDGDGDPNEHPVQAPWPSPDDPEQDGDPDGDGDPDETNPAPTPAPLPDNDPDSDPDQDGDPNHSDPDDDGDSYPDETDPAPNNPNVPGPDTDKDGDPDSSDPDDDGDGYEDHEDPFPGDPNRPKDDPTWDRDRDQVPDRIDPYPTDPSRPSRWTREDRDKDFSPDTFDPSPDDPNSPQPSPEPNSDTDNDGTPNQHDPFPTDPANPAKPNPDLDDDGTPTINDPDPYRPDQPTGGPTGDSDGDGSPNGSDPYPQDPNDGKPPTQSAGCFATPPRNNIEGPDGNYSSIFPFNLFAMAVGAISALGAEPKAPPLPVLFPDAQANSEPFSLSEFDEQAALARLIFSVAGIIYGCFFMYKLVSQSKEGE